MYLHFWNFQLYFTRSDTSFSDTSMIFNLHNCSLTSHITPHITPRWPSHRTLEPIIHAHLDTFVHLFIACYHFEAQDWAHRSTFLLSESSRSSIWLHKLIRAVTGRLARTDVVAEFLRDTRLTRAMHRPTLPSLSLAFSRRHGGKILRSHWSIYFKFAMLINK